MERYLEIARGSFVGYARYLWHEVTHPGWGNYFYALIAVSLLFLCLELLVPWRKDQPRVREGFWLDGFYMFFNFFLFSLIGYNALSDVVSTAFRDLLASVGIRNLVAIRVAALPAVAQLSILFVLRDFIHYWGHRLLHRVGFLWNIHKVHHSVRQMGFAAHLRYHFGETIVYRTLEYVPLALIGFGLQEFFLVHLIALSIGHFNHSNIHPPIGPLKYIINSPQMHIWHHAKKLPARYGANFGISLSLWDWLFRTVHWPTNGRDIELGFPEVERYPKGFLGQLVAPFR
jgi:sterol desaturase/sphingolipid hydroxylase (fatty acid hydroxylase superfamily)